MPTVLRAGPYRIYYFKGEVEPPHVHVDRDDLTAKFWLDPLRLAWGGRYRPHELRRIRCILEEHRERLLETWHGMQGP